MNITEFLKGKKFETETIHKPFFEQGWMSSDNGRFIGSEVSFLTGKFGEVVNFFLSEDCEPDEMEMMERIVNTHFRVGERLNLVVTLPDGGEMTYCHSHCGKYIVARGVMFAIFWKGSENEENSNI